MLDKNTYDLSTISSIIITVILSISLLCKVLMCGGLWNTSYICQKDNDDEYTSVIFPWCFASSDAGFVIRGMNGNANS